MGLMIKDYAAHNKTLPFIPKEIHDYIVGYFDDDMMKKLLDGQRMETLISKGTSLITASVEFLIHTLEWFLTFIYVIFILLDYRQLMRGFGKLVRPKYRPIFPRAGRPRPLRGGILLYRVLHRRHTTGNSARNPRGNPLHDSLFPIYHPHPRGFCMRNSFDGRRILILV